MARKAVLIFITLFTLALSACDNTADDTSLDTGVICSGELYVNAGTGDDAFPGTRASPFKTLTTALTFVVAGQTVCVSP